MLGFGAWGSVGWCIFLRGGGARLERKRLKNCSKKKTLVTFAFFAGKGFRKKNRDFFFLSKEREKLNQIISVCLYSFFFSC